MTDLPAFEKSIPIDASHKFDLGDHWSVDPYVKASEEVTTDKHLLNKPDVSAFGVNFEFDY